MILLIDDNDIERAMIRKMLESGGHEVREAPGGDEGVVLFGELAPDLVLCDLMMPRKDGFATVAEIQGHTPNAKIVAMSGVWYGTTDHRAMADSLGLAAVIEKPFERTALLNLVKKTLAPKRPKRVAKPTKARAAHKKSVPKKATAKRATAKKARRKQAARHPRTAKKAPKRR